jgi:hypothetical protein
MSDDFRHPRLIPELVEGLSRYDRFLHTVIPSPGLSCEVPRSLWGEVPRSLWGEVPRSLWGEVPDRREWEAKSKGSRGITVSTYAFWG